MNVPFDRPIVDAHQHLWDPSARSYPWMSSSTRAINRPFTAADLQLAMSSTPVSSAVAVQAMSSREETQALLSVSAGSGPVTGVVGWVDLERADVGEQLSELAAHPGHLVGIRHQVNAEPDHSWLLRPSVIRGLKAVRDHGLAYDLLVREDQRASALHIASTLEGLTFVLDHAGDPAPAANADADAEWRGWLSRMAERSNVVCKVSGLVKGTDRAVLDRASSLMMQAVQIFGADRSMFGSDWPVSLLGASYWFVWETTRAAMAALSESEQAALFSETAHDTYQLTRK